MLAGRASVGSLERHLGALGDAGNHGAALGQVLDLDLALLEAVAGLDEDVGLAVLLEHRLARHVEGVRDFLAFDHHPGRGARLEARIGRIELEADVEQPRDGRALVPLRPRRQPRQRADADDELLAGQRVDVEGGGLT